MNRVLESESSMDCNNSSRVATIFSSTGTIRHFTVRVVLPTGIMVSILTLHCADRELAVMTLISSDHSTALSQSAVR